MEVGSGRLRKEGWVRGGGRKGGGKGGGGSGSPASHNVWGGRAVGEKGRVDDVARATVWMRERFSY